MNLLEIANFCAATLGMTDNLTVTQAKTFAGLRWKMIWDSNNWRQSHMELECDVPAGTEDVLVSPEAETVLAVRINGDRELLPSMDLTELSSAPQAYGTANGVTMAFSIVAGTATQTRIRLHAPVKTATKLLLVCKRRCMPLAADTDKPTLSGVDQCLIAFTMGDLYRWQRQFSKAEQLYREAETHLGKMVEIETTQSGRIARIIPFDAYSTEYFN